MKNHMKRLIAPRRWNVLRKVSRFVARPNPGGHSFEHGVPLVVFLRDMVSVAKNAKEARYVITQNGVFVDRRRRMDSKFLVGLMDTVDFPLTKECFRVVVNSEGKIGYVKIPEKEAGTKLCRITGKRMSQGKVQISTHDGRTMLVDNKEYKIGDTLYIELPSQKILEHLGLEPKMFVYLVGGKHAGSKGIIESVTGNKLTYKTNDGKLFETLRDYAFVVGRTKPTITLDEEPE